MSGRKMIYKIIILGDGAVGKTSLNMRFIGKGFSADYKLTIGADISTKDMEIDGEFYGSISIWDLGGQERFSFVRPTYYKNTRGALLVFDVTRKATLDNVKRWMTELLQFAEDVSVILVGNKIDLAEARQVTPEMAEAVARELNIPYIETSAKTGENVSESFEKLTLLIRDEFTAKLSEEEYLQEKRKTGVYNLEELPAKISEAGNLAEKKKFFEAAEIYRRIADTYRLERDTKASKGADKLTTEALNYYTLSAEIYLKAKRYTESAWSYEHLRSLRETLGDYKGSLEAFILSAENYEKAGNLPGAAWRYSAIAGLFESNFEFKKAYNFNLKSWKTYLEGKEFSMIFEPIQKLSTYYERENNFEKIGELWIKTIKEANTSENYFWAAQLLELYIDLYCPPENKSLEREKALDSYLRAAEKFQVEKNSSLEARSILFAAKNAIQLKQIDKATELYEKVLQYYIEIQIWPQAATIATILGRHEQAIKYYRKEVQENKNTFYEPYQFISMGEYYVISKDHNKATENFKLASQAIQKIKKEDLPKWKQEELAYLEHWVEARILFQEGVKNSEIDNHSKAQEKYKMAAEKFEQGIVENISDEKRNLLKAFINLSNGLHIFEEIQKLEEKGDLESVKKQQRLLNFNLSRANANFVKASQFNISQLINSILEAVKANKFSEVKAKAANVFPSFQPVSAQKISKLGLANAFLNFSIEDIKPLQVEVNDSCALSVRIGIDEKFFNEASEDWLSLFLTCSNSIFEPISIPVTFTKQLTQFNHTFTPKFTESGETTIRLQVKDIEQTMALKSLITNPIKVLKEYIPLLINLTIEAEEETIYTSCTLSGPVTQKINPLKSKVKVSKLLELASQIEHVAMGTEPTKNFERLGKGLYEAIIPESIRTEIHNAVQFANSQDVPINFMVSSSRNLMSVPFELFNSDDKSINGFFSTKFPLFRYPVEKKLMPIEKLTSRIAKVLLISANPLEGELDLPNVDNENKDIQDLLAKIGVHTKMITSDRAKLQNVLEELLVNDYEAIHFSGHGIFDPKNPMESGLMLGTKGSPPEFLTANNIKEILQETKLKLIFLNSCYSATQSSQTLEKEEVLGIADAFIQVGVPTIIGMQWPITDQGALILSENFYNHVFKNNIDFQTALKLARLQLITHRPKDPSWACPMLVKHPSL
ncbi:MAG: CHAT domain-containing protein [Promethearchaeota archaeon]